MWSSTLCVVQRSKRYHQPEHLISIVFACAQFNKVIQNYQKAYRKKVEGLKTELKATRNTIDLLRGQVKDLKKVTRVHIPSLAVGVLAGVFLKALAQAAKTLQSRLKSSEVQDSQDTEAAHDDHATSETEHAQELSSGQPA